MNADFRPVQGRELPRFPQNIPVTYDLSILAGFQQDESTRRGVRPLAMAHCTSSAEIEQIIRWANENGIRVVPVSSAAGPRRRGDTISTEPVLILDLSRMKRVIHMDGADAIAIIEPGVTFNEFDKALKPHGLRSFRPLTARSDKSVLAAFLEREPMTVPSAHWDSADPLAAFELIFGNGDLFRTGGAALPGSLDENLARGNRQMLSTGPMHTDFGRVIQGAQGAYAVVSWASIYCQRIPAKEIPLFVSSGELEPLVELAYRQLRRRLNSQLFIMNGMQLARIMGATKENISELASQLPKWILYTEITASDHLVEQAIAYRRADFERDAALLGLRASGETGGVLCSDFSSRLRSSHGHADVKLDLANQEVFCLTQLDLAVEQISSLGAEINEKSAIYLQPLAHGVNAHLQVTIYSPKNQEDELAEKAVSVATLLSRKGGFFSRPYYPWAHIPFDQDPDIVSYLTKTKQLFDVNGVLQPNAQSLGRSCNGASK